jgi:hypothetical protein
MIQRLTIDQLPQAVDLHARILHWSINARLGRPHLIKVYQTLIEDPDCLCYADIARDGALLSLIITSKNWPATRQKIKAIYRLGTRLKLLWQSLYKPLDYIDIFENMLVIPPVLKQLNRPAEILIWLADTAELRGRVSGVKIMRSTLQTLDEIHMLPAIAQVAKYDAAPNSYHANAGNRLTHSFWRNNLYLVGKQNG